MEVAGTGLSKSDIGFVTSFAELETLSKSMRLIPYKSFFLHRKQPFFYKKKILRGAMLYKMERSIEQFS